MERRLNILLISGLFFASMSYGKADSAQHHPGSDARSGIDELYYACMELWTQIDLIRASTTSLEAKREAAVALCDKTIDIFGKLLINLKLNQLDPKEIEKLKRIGFKLKLAYDNTFTADHGEHACAIFVLLAKMEEILFKKSFSNQQIINDASIIQHPTDLLSYWY